MGFARGYHLVFCWVDQDNLARVGREDELDKTDSADHVGSEDRAVESGESDMMDTMGKKGKKDKTGKMDTTDTMDSLDMMDTTDNSTMPLLLHIERNSIDLLIGNQRAFFHTRTSLHHKQHLPSKMIL